MAAWYRADADDAAVVGILRLPAYALAAFRAAGHAVADLAQPHDTGAVVGLSPDALTLLTAMHTGDSGLADGGRVASDTVVEIAHPHDADRVGVGETVSPDTVAGASAVDPVAAALIHACDAGLTGCVTQPEDAVPLCALTLDAGSPGI
ncbi:hypothetical protein ADK60_15865 [Streptomyces sp. XY431]|nr:hypothetical protein ADK60_15865 [Streptomyces sp. XY431]